MDCMGARKSHTKSGNGFHLQPFLKFFFPKESLRPALEWEDGCWIVKSIAKLGHRDLTKQRWVKLSNEKYGLLVVEGICWGWDTTHQVFPFVTQTWVFFLSGLEKGWSLSDLHLADLFGSRTEEAGSYYPGLFHTRMSMVLSKYSITYISRLDTSPK